MKRNHIIGHHVTLTIHMVLLYMEMLFFSLFLLVIKKKKRLSLCGCLKTANAENTFVVFYIFQSTGRCFSLSDGMKAQTKNLLHWSSEISLGERFSGVGGGESKKLFFFSLLKSLKVNYKVKTILMKTHKHLLQ